MTLGAGRDGQPRFLNEHWVDKKTKKTQYSIIYFQLKVVPLQSETKTVQRHESKVSIIQRG